MEVLSLNQPFERSDPSIVYGMWGNHPHEGLECQVEALDSAQFYFTPSVLDVDPADPNPVDPDPAIDDDGQQRDLPNITNMFRRLVPKRFRRRPRRRTYQKSSGKNSDDDISVATTISIVSRSSSMADNSVASAPALGAQNHELRDPMILEFLRLLVETSTTESPVEIVLEDDKKDVPLMQSRLFQTGIVTSEEDFEFVADYVSKEVVTDEEKKDQALAEQGVSHVKTGVWEVICLADDGTPKDPFYIVTGVSMDDRVDTKKLRKAVFSGQSYKRRPKLNMAPTPIAERLAGYQSGTMAPICHTVPMKLYLEETIANVDDEHKINVGSGMVGKCLSIDAKRFKDIATLNPKGFEVVSLIRTKKK